MSGYVSDEEYARIKASWQAAPRKCAPFTNAQMVAACLANIDEAAKRQGELGRLFHSLPPGDVRLVGDKGQPSMAERIRAAASDQRHWRAELTFWRGRCVAEGDDFVPRVTVRVRALADEMVAAANRKMNDPATFAVPDRRLPREPGDDDADAF